MRNTVLAATSALAIMIAGTSAMAQEMEKSASAKMGKNYIRIDGGAVWFSDVDFSTGLAAHGLTTTAAGHYTFDVGTSVSGTWGHRFSKQMRGEIELNYMTADFDTVNGAMTLTAGGASRTVSTSLGVSGDVTQMGGYANLLFDIGNDKRFTPYVGGGLGFLNTKTAINKIDTMVVNGEETDTNFAAHGTAGLDYYIKDGVSLGARYRYTWVNSEREGLDNMASHALAATLTFDL